MSSFCYTYVLAPLMWPKEKVTYVLAPLMWPKEKVK
jgi:hypothetical protein